MGPGTVASPLRARRYDSWDWPRLLRHGYIVFVLAMSAVTISGHGQTGMDGRAYWLSDLSHLYGLGSSHDDAFLYSPAFAELVAPLTNLPWWRSRRSSHRSCGPNGSASSPQPLNRSRVDQTYRGSRRSRSHCWSVCRLPRSLSCTAP